ncbi:MAG: carbon-nitrogen hydrolase family protein [Tannerella sp.]|nr:carbon-nitrogen hydrolase family protein [Tannerella sp.]
MKTFKPISRRHFMEKAAVTAGLSVLGAEAASGRPSDPNQSPAGKLPREVWIATVSQHGLSADTSEKMAQMILAIMEKSVTCHPDVLCLPEVFMTTFIRESMSLSDKTDISTGLLKGFMAFAQANQCDLICPTYLRENGKTYNAAVVIDRKGTRIGDYKKTFITDDELATGLSPSPQQPPPVFKTDFGTIGIQICFDINWNENWKALRMQGAEIIFWPSAFGGGQQINTKAWQNKVVVVSSTNKDTSKICDISGNTVAQTGIWDRNLICAPVNLEKAFLHTWPFVRRFDEIKAKYGRKVRITNYHEEEWSIIESLSPDVRVKDILEEFDLRTYEQLIRDSENFNAKARG